MDSQPAVGSGASEAAEDTERERGPLGEDLHQHIVSKHAVGEVAGPGASGLGAGTRQSISPAFASHPTAPTERAHHHSRYRSCSRPYRTNGVSPEAEGRSERHYSFMSWAPELGVS